MPILGPRLVMNDEVSDTSPVIEGTWVTVNHIVSLIVDGWTWTDILGTHPELSEGDIRIALDYSVAENLETCPGTVDGTKGPRYTIKKMSTTTHLWCVMDGSTQVSAWNTWNWATNEAKMLNETLKNKGETRVSPWSMFGTDLLVDLVFKNCLRDAAKAEVKVELLSRLK